MDAQPLPELGADAPTGYVGMAFLARGGSATAYRSRRVSDGGAVVVKVAEVAGGSTEREIRSAAALEGVAGVTPVLDHGTLTDGRHFLVTPFQPGGSLTRAVEGAPLPPGEVAVLGVRLGTALAEAHRRGVVHGDVKPSNVLLGADGAVLSDFGAARQVTGVAATQPETVAITVLYAAPEVLEGAVPDERSDQYSLGITLTALLLGRPPFEPGPGGVVALLDDICRGRLPGLPADTPDWLAGVLRRACATDPSDRFDSVAALVTALEERDPGPDGARRTTGSRVGIALAAVALSVAAVVVAVLVLRGTEDRATADRAAGDRLATPTVPPPAAPRAPDLIRSASAPFAPDAAIPVPSGGQGYLEVATYVPADKYSICLPADLQALYRFAAALCGVQFRGDAHARTYPAALDPSRSRLYVRVDFRDHTVTASAHSGCSNRAVDSPATCVPTTPVVETDGAYSDRFRAKWRWCDEAPLEMTAPIDAGNVNRCLTAVGQWFGVGQPATPYVHFSAMTRPDRGSTPPYYRLNGDMPSDSGTVDLPRLLQDFEIDLRNDGTIRVRRDCYPAMEIHWVDAAGRRLIYDGAVDNRVGDLPVEINAAKDKECEATVPWGR
ncbi:MAG: protein kinase domain-containing protein [Microthrixaceae bacterium]